MYERFKELSTAWALASALYKREVSALEVLTKSVEDDQIGSIYPFTIRPNYYWEKRTEEIKEVIRDNLKNVKIVGFIVSHVP